MTRLLAFLERRHSRVTRRSNAKYHRILSAAVTTRRKPR